ncbi:SUMF1/EgtB/PvdO family nonheme iron enzyme [Aquabacterium sp.]|uniref:SUMF1/EgtB/PvdO family nonheme iron enzyme n=1 Tax=Aquabacterium sp. TaxID=1872578 RepID=UPI002CFFF018|nr:SUMF1/EgtB/PvdO family nonheme iron enzyme [Aquabacterium sp.]HSW06192.1 SUMF1/EgtB/PvdO family nonheme iron enzyme [Aquabacterium sp.]
MSASSFVAVDIHDPQGMRQAGADALSLALMDARNRTLQRLAVFDGLHSVTAPTELDPPAWIAGQAARFQEYWIGRNVLRNRGEACDPKAVRLASIDPVLDWWLDPLASTRAQRWQGSVPAAEAMRSYLAATLEDTLDLLEKAEASDEGLYFYRLALRHEDRLGEALAVLAQTLGAAPQQPEQRWPELPSRVRREALCLPARTVQLGSPRGGCVPDNEKWAHELVVPEFEIDAQPVCWAQYAEFVADGGYDDARWWSAEGWQWADATGRRAPRHVEQLAHGVLLRRQGRLQRVPGVQAAVHLSWYEADAWCRWAGRRLPSEGEWSVAAADATARGWVWGDVFEWVAGTARAYPGYRNGPAWLDALPSEPGWRVLRGASFLSAARQKHLAARRFLPPGHDACFCGFRSCAV